MKKEKREELYSQNRLLHPKLRMYTNANSKVSSIRSELSACMVVSKLDKPFAKKSYPGIISVPVSEPLGKQKTKIQKLKEVSSNTKVNVFLELPIQETKINKQKGENRRKGSLITATIDFNDIKELSNSGKNNTTPLYIELGQPLKIPSPIINSSYPLSANKGIESLLPNNQHTLIEELSEKSSEILIGIIDVQGYDFAHQDFRDGKGTRFLKIWDMGGKEGNKPDGFTYGVELSQDNMNQAILEGEKNGFPPTQFLEQSQMEAGSHGTHVASIAAGNNGICQKANIIGVTIDIPKKDLERRKSFYDSTRLAHAFDYLIAEAEKEGKPISINISLGTNGHAHDGTAPINRWIDSELTKPGRAVCVASGNAGQEKPSFEDDLGFVMGRIHTSGQIPSNGLVKDIEWIVVGNTLADISENELEIWYNSQDRFAVEIKPPNGDWIGPIEVLEYIENLQLSDGSFLSIYNEVYNPSNGSNYIGIYLSPAMLDKDEGGIIGIPAGKWTVRLHGREIRDGRYDAWIERDDARPIGKLGEKQYWNFPSFFTEKTNKDFSSISSLACGNNIIAVANLHEANEIINISSSQGPTRDGRAKPDVAAPGTNIIAAKGFSTSNDPWISMTGTSMASPHVCGVVGLLLALNPELTAAQIIGVLRRTSNPLPGSDYGWKDDSGFGAIDLYKSIQEVKTFFNKRTDKKGEYEN